MKISIVTSIPFKVKAIKFYIVRVPIYLVAFVGSYCV